LINRTLTYDLNGRLTNDGSARTFEWDGANRLVAVNYTGTTNRSEFSYDGVSRVAKIVEKTAGNITATRKFVWCGMEKCEFRDAADAVTLRVYPQGQHNGTAAYFFTRDHLGSIREMSKGTGTVVARYDYDPYGRSTTVIGNAPTDFNFTGLYRHSKSNLDLTTYRAYDPDLGRWLSRDPIGEKGGINLYGYAENSPIEHIDPSGENPVLILAILAIYFSLDRYANAPAPGDSIYTGTAPNALAYIDGAAAVPGLVGGGVRCAATTAINNSQIFLREGDAVLAIIKDGEVIRMGDVGLSHEVFGERAMGALPQGAEVVTIGKSGGQIYALTSRTFSGTQTNASQAAQDAAQLVFR
jgi:RHS repeat-associated protein